MSDPSPAEPRFPRTILGMGMGYMLASAVHVAAALGLADLLSAGPKSAAELARATGTHPLSLERLLRALAANGVFAFADSRFALTPFAEPLRSDIPHSVRQFVLNGHTPWLVSSWQQMLASIQTGVPAFNRLTGKPLFEYMQENPEEARDFDRMMQTHTRATLLPLLPACAFEPETRIVDVGGGDGTFLQEILRANPTCRGTVFDETRVIEAARERPAAPEVAGRLQFESGDFFKSVPAGAQAYILKHVLHDWDDAGARRILRSCSRALPRGARVLIIELVLQPHEQRPFETMMDLGIMLTTGGLERSEEEYRRLCREAGRLVPQGLSATAGPDSVFIAVKE